MSQQTEGCINEKQNGVGALLLSVSPNPAVGAMGGAWRLLPRPPLDPAPTRLRPHSAPPPRACPVVGGVLRAGGDEAGARGRVERAGRAALLAGRLDRAGRPHLLQPHGKSQHRYRQRGLRAPPGPGAGGTRPRFHGGRARSVPVVSGAGLV